jgi:hypothetical protein
MEVKMLTKYLERLNLKRLIPAQAHKGQSIIIITFAFLGLIAMLGLALDLGLVYIERVRISRTTDAAALAAVVELPFEEEAMRRAVEYIELNGYQVGVDTQILVRGCIDNGGDWVNVLENDDDGLDPDDPLQPVYKPTGQVVGYVYRPAVVPNPRAVFVIDTLAYQAIDSATVSQDSCETDLVAGTANKLRVTGQVMVDMNFMQFFGFGEVPVSDQAVGENVTNLDIVVVFDVSGSMNFETTCFGCWEKANPEKDVLKNPWPKNGFTYAVSTSVVTGTLCTAVPASTQIPGLAATERYMTVEAEHYSENYPPESWYFKNREAGKGFWVVQRSPTGEDGASRNASSAVDTRGAYIRAHPLTTYSQSQASQNPQLQGMSYDDECFQAATGYQCWKSDANNLNPKESPPATMSQVPYVEYDFDPTWTGTTHIWVRAEAAGTYAFAWNGFRPTTMIVWDKALYWHGGPADDEAGWPAVQGGVFNVDVADYTCPGGTCGDDTGPIGSRWRWVKLGSIATPDNAKQYTLRIYQGSTAMSIDKILFTNFSGGQAQTQGVKNDGSLVGGGSLDPNFRNLLAQNGGKGPNLGGTPGSATREACNLCNPIFGQTVDETQCSCKKNKDDTAVANAADYPAGGAGLGCTSLITTTNHLVDSDLYHDIDPLRSAKEAVKNFAARLDAKFDQIGFVTFSKVVNTGATQRAEMQCIRWSTKNDAINGVRGCYATNPISYTKVISNIETQVNSGNTNIGAAFKEGLTELGLDPDDDNEYQNSDCAPAVNDGSVCDRRGAARRILILMTDGSPNESTGCSNNATNDLPWQGDPGEDDPDYNCPVYYGKFAYDNNVTVYTIGIGSGANPALLETMATGIDPTTDPPTEYWKGGTERGGDYFPAPKPSDLDAIFEKILQNVFVRIVG